MLLMGSCFFTGHLDPCSGFSQVFLEHFSWIYQQVFSCFLLTSICWSEGMFHFLAPLSFLRKVISVPGILFLAFSNTQIPTVGEQWYLSFHCQWWEKVVVKTEQLRSTSTHRGRLLYGAGRDKGWLFTGGFPEDCILLNCTLYSAG